jgi:hypothetical protein
LSWQQIKYYLVSLKRRDGVDPAPVRLILTKLDKLETFHYEVDLEETREKHAAMDSKDPKSGEVLGKRHFFSEHLTHAGWPYSVDGEGNGFILCQV